MDLDMRKNQYDNIDFNFTPSRKGYDPEEVEVVLAAHKQQLELLSEQNRRLKEEYVKASETLSRCNARIQMLFENTQVLQQERQRETMRLAQVMTAAGKTAEETVSDARRKAAEIIADANIAAERSWQKAKVEVDAAQRELESLIQVLHTARDSSNQHFDSINAVLKSISNIMASKKTTSYSPTEHSQEAFDSRFAAGNFQPEGQLSAYRPLSDDTDIYDAFLNEMGLADNRYTGNHTTRGKIIEHFGD